MLLTAFTSRSRHPANGTKPDLPAKIICTARVVSDCVPDKAKIRDPLQGQAADVFAGQLAADRVPSVRAIREQFHVGRSRAHDCRTTSLRE
jgi:hypothetical protein